MIAACHFLTSAVHCQLPTLCGKEAFSFNEQQLQADMTAGRPGFELNQTSKLFDKASIATNLVA